MVVCTKSCALLVKKVYKQNELVTSTVQNIISRLKVDPSLLTTKNIIECFIVHTQDIRRNEREEFLNNVKKRHEKWHLIYIAEKLESDIDKNDFDSVLIKPKGDDIKEAVDRLAENINVKSEIASSMSSVTEEPIGLYSPDIPVYKEDSNESFRGKEIVQEKLPEVEIAHYEPEPVLDETPHEVDYADRIKSCQRMIDATTIAKEISAHNLIKRIAQENAQYTAIEAKLKSMQEKVFSIMADAKLSRVEDKLIAVRAVLEDKEYYSVQNSTIVEQTVSNIIDVLTTKTIELVRSRIEQLDAAILKTTLKQSPEDTTIRLAGIQDSKASLILELATLQEEIKGMASKVDSLATDTVAFIAEGVDNMTGSPILDSQLRRQSSPMISAATIGILTRLLEKGNSANPEFKELNIKVKELQMKINMLFDLDREEIAAQQAVLSYLKSHKIEDTVIAKTLLKRALRVWVGYEGSGVTSITLILTYMKSCTNSNALLVDLSGACKYNDYGQNMVDLEYFTNNIVEKPFCVVQSAKPVEGAGAIQRIITALNKAADYYRVINVVVAPTQLEVFHSMANDVLSINYVVDDSFRRVQCMAQLIKDSTIENTAQRIVVNKSKVCLADTVAKLGLSDSLSFSVIEIPEIPELPNCAWKGIPPYNLNIVTEMMSEASKHA